MNGQPLAQLLDQLDRHPPSYTVHPEREQTLLDIGRLLETNIRAGQPFDLKAIHPNLLWELLEDRLRAALDRIRHERAGPGVIRVNQWYSSGVILDVDAQLLGFDVVPMRREYDWPDRYDMTRQLAQCLDALFVTHRHHDHYDESLVRACLEEGTLVYMPEDLAQTWDGAATPVPVGCDQQWEMQGFQVCARAGIHVWRDTAEELALRVYELAWPDGTGIVYGGDVDYTKALERTEGLRIKAFFLPWRAPNALYEEGDARQVAPLHDAVRLALEKLDPAILFYEHCAELEHVYDGFPASFDMAFNLKKCLPVSSELLFWGEWMDIPVG